MLWQVDKILGPGNQYVTAAKMLLQNSEAMVSMDMPAGPSEVSHAGSESAGSCSTFERLAQECSLSQTQPQDMDTGHMLLQVLVIADENAAPAFIAADLLSQAEHGPDSQVHCRKYTLHSFTATRNIIVRRHAHTASVPT